MPLPQTGPSDPPTQQPFSGQIVAFSGKLLSFSRREARTLIERLGGTVADDLSVATTLLVIGAASVAAEGEKSAKVRRADEINAKHPGQVTIVSEEAFCARAGVPTPGELRRQYHALRDIVGRYHALREDHIRYLVKYGLVRPVLRTNADVLFSFADLAVIKQVAEDLARGQAFRAILRGLRASQLGQLSFDFRAEGAPARVVALVPRPAAPAAPVRPDAEALFRAEEAFRIASQLDDSDDGDRAEAAAAYQRALEFDPHLVPALINLANIHYAHDELVDAQALYERAIADGPEFFEAHFNLGNVHHDMGQFDEARRCYEQALSLNPYYADAHFYLAVTLEKMGLSADARPHWLSYQQLAPTGEWIQLAREFAE